MTVAEKAPDRWATGRPGSKKRRRPSGEPPPLASSLASTGKYWIALLVAGVVSWIAILAIAAGPAVERFDLAILEGVAEIRTAWLTRVAKSTAALGSEWVILALRWGIIVALL